MNLMEIPTSQNYTIAWLDSHVHISQQVKRQQLQPTALRACACYYCSDILYLFE